jgi:NADPH:quinone reductase-like Zn-dependent oxidoreductase/predicted O-methyltransferase YrrM
MISINLASEQVPEFLSKIFQKGVQSVGIACINSPLNVTLSGPEAGIDAVKAQADQENIFAQKLKTGVAYHSSAMSSLASEYLSLMGDLESTEVLPVPVYSSVTGKTLEPEEFANGEYWVANMVSPVRFAGAVKLMASRSPNQGSMDWVEIGPHPVLKRYVQDTLGTVKLQYSSVLQRGYSASQKALEIAGTLFCRGHPISTTAVNNQGRKEDRSASFLVDCPPYPFDHSNNFLSESRFSKDYRLRTPTKGGLLGQRALDWNPLQPRWRSFLSVETYPWIGHHVVSDLVLYPAAAMLIMAFEAVQEVVPSSEITAGYFVKEAQFLNPVVVPESYDDRIELVTSLQSTKNHSRDSKLSCSWSDVRIFTYAKENHTWNEVFRASVQARYASTVEQTESLMANKAIQEQHRQAREACSFPIDPQMLYGDAFEHGLQYGEWFQISKEIKWDKSGACAVARVSVLDNPKYETASIVHPAVLDTMFHVLRASAGQQQAANVPLRVTDAWFTSDKWQGPGKESVHWLATSKGSTGKAVRGERGSVSALAEDGTVLAMIEKLVTASISSNDSDFLAQGEYPRQKTLLHGIEWRPQLSMLSSEQLSQVCKSDHFAHDPEVTLADHRRRTVVLNIAAVRHVKNVPEGQRAKLNSTLRQHMEWMEHHVQLLSPQERAAAEALTDAEYEAELDAFSAAFPTWTLYPHVMRSLPAIMTGEIDPLQVIFESEYAKTFYASLFHPVCGDGRLGRFLDLAAHENPSLRILEVGAGTGGMTVHILNALREREKHTGALAFVEYMYTDITPAFFESAKARWESEGLGHRMSFKSLDMEHSVLDQGFAKHSYDLVIGGSCIHATKLLSNTLQNLRCLLKPGGKLMMLEMTKPTDITSCFFATLASGWWLSQEEERVNNKSPLVSDDAWDQKLKQNGYSGNDLVLMDTKEGDAHIASVIISTAVNVETEEGLASPPRRVFIIDPQQESQMELGRLLSERQDAILALDEIANTDISTDDVVVSLVEVDNPLLASISETQFTQLQALFKQTRSLSWVTAPKDGAADTHFPHYAVAQGFLRTVRAEMPDLQIISLSIEDASNNEMRVRAINQTIEAAFAAYPAPELEYVFRSGQMHTARAVEKISANIQLRSLLYPQLKQLKWADSPAVKLAIGTKGDLQSLRFEQDEKHGPSLGPCDIEIEARAWGLNQSDIHTALDRLDDDNIGDGFGAGCSGVVTQIGRDCDSQGPQPGDHVIMLSRGCVSNLPRAHKTRVFQISSPSTILTFETAAAALWPAVTAYRALVDIARVCSGDKVLIHEAASSVGQMAVQIARMEGAEVFVTMDTKSSGGTAEEKEKQLLIITLGITPEHIFSASCNTTSFAGGIRRATKGYGVDVVLNTLADDQLHASLELLATGGRLVDIGLGKGALSPNAAASTRNTSFAAVDVLGLPAHVTARLLKDVMSLLDKGKITPPEAFGVFSTTKVKEAFRELQKGEGQDHVVLIPPKPDDVLPQVALDPQALRPCKFDENVSYFIPGGLGGVGRSIVAWMATCGAKHLIVPSRSGPSSAAAAKLVSSLSASGVNIVTPKCDVAKEAELAALLAGIEQTMPPIRGIINCAMVLPNAVFTNMSFEQWSSAVNTKVAVSFNLHRVLPNHEKLDFFIHLASLAGVNGQMASSNYAGGCSFQDALAACYPGVVTLDVGWMSDVGLIAETAAFQRQLKDWSNMQRLEERELLGILGLVCNAKQTQDGEEMDDRTIGQQVLVGLRTPADFLSKSPGPLPPVLNRPLLSTFAQPINYTKDGNAKASKGSSAKATALDHKALFLTAADDESRASVVASALAEKLGRAIMMSADEVDPDRALSAYGVDSLMAIDVRNWLGREFCAKLSIWEIMNEERKINMIAKTVVQKSTMMEV